MPALTTRIRDAAGAARRARQGPRERPCPRCGTGVLRRVCCGGANGHLAVCAECGHLARWEDRPRNPVELRGRDRGTRLHPAAADGGRRDAA